MKKRLIRKLHKWLFPSLHQELISSRILKDIAQEERDSLQLEILAKNDLIIKLETRPQPTIADLMRDSLKLITVDFVNQEKGLPKHFLDLPDTLDGKDTRNMYIAQLAQIQGLEVWQVLMQYLINAQGNYTLRIAPTDMEVFAGRMQISGISLVKEEVKNGYEEYMVKVGPKEDFDATDHSTEGISFSEDQ